MIKKVYIALCLACIGLSVKAQDLQTVAKQLDIFNRVYTTLEMYYVDTLDAKKNINTALTSMLYNMDPYTEYYDAKDAKDFTTATTGKYAGVGSVIHYYKAEDRCIIYQLYEGKPAHKAGLQVGDVILSINGKDTGKKGTTAVSDYVSSVSSALRGDPGTVAKVRVKRPGVEGELEFDVVRANVHLASVPYCGMVDETTGYVVLNSFTMDCAEEVRDSILKLKEMGATQLVLDLRQNGGGLANEAVSLVNLFVPKGKLIVKMKGRYGNPKSYATQQVPDFPEMPVVVLVDGGSASAAEITCGALQDLDRAVVMGERTYGKGLVQQTYEMPDGGILKFTQSHYYIPSGRCIQALDYSHRDENGEVRRTPDSLTTVFYTELGRPVRDGGGITPDVNVKSDSMSTYLSYLFVSDELFDYVTDYCRTHSTIAPPKEFMISDEDYEEFIKKIVASNFTPEYRSVKIVEQLEKEMKREEMDDKALKQLNALKENLKPKAEDILRKEKDNAKNLLSSVICDRYYYDAGTVAHKLTYDNQLKEAIALLHDTMRYKEILSKPKK